MLGLTHKVNWSHWLRLKVLAFAVVSAAVFVGAASAQPDEGGALSSQPSVITYLVDTAAIEQGAGGVTPTNLARAVVDRGNGGVTPTNLARAYVPRLADRPALIRDVPDGVPSDVPRTAPAVFVTDGGGWLDESELAFGFGLGLALAAVAAIALMLSRNRMRVAQS